VSDDTMKANPKYRNVALDVPGWKAEAVVCVESTPPRLELVYVQAAGKHVDMIHDVRLAGDLPTAIVDIDALGHAVGVETIYPDEVEGDAEARKAVERSCPEGAAMWTALVDACRQAIECASGRAKDKP